MLNMNAADQAAHICTKEGNRMGAWFTAKSSTALLMALAEKKDAVAMVKVVNTISQKGLKFRATVDMAPVLMQAASEKNDAELYDAALLACKDIINTADIDSLKSKYPRPTAEAPVTEIATSAETKK